MLTKKPAHYINMFELRFSERVFVINLINNIFKLSWHYRYFNFFQSL